MESLEKIGLDCRRIRGFVSSLGDAADAFVPREWVEAKLPGGQRLVVDLGDSFKISAGDADDYVVSDPHPHVEVE